mmetsp:Transcript_8239/g.23595  ORF Transcript_8239/g.23595 Transcript_8239/m.23595 type:complete len:214 (+) Transcript_8239:929-1570(+)
MQRLDACCQLVLLVSQQRRIVARLVLRNDGPAQHQLHVVASLVTQLLGPSALEHDGPLRAPRRLRAVGVDRGPVPRAVRRLAEELRGAPVGVHQRPSRVTVVGHEGEVRAPARREDGDRGAHGQGEPSRQRERGELRDRRQQARLGQLRRRNIASLARAALHVLQHGNIGRVPLGARAPRARRGGDAQQRQRHQHARVLHGGSVQTAVCSIDG